MRLNKIYILLFLVITLNAFIWMILVPIWHFPDEQSHFAQVVYVVEKGKNPDGKQLDLTEEILVSERLLGTERDKYGNNRFTFHPEYRIEYTEDLMGIYESSISALAKTDAKKHFVHREASRYPLLYYFLASAVYRLFYNTDLFTRIFAVRFLSLLFYITNIFFVYKFSKTLFEKDKPAIITLTLTVAFQPMMVFANVGVNSDALGNLLITLFLYITTRIIILGPYRYEIFIATLLTIASLATKPQFFMIVPSLLIVIIWSLFNSKMRLKKHELLISVIFITLVGSFFYYLRLNPLMFIIDFFNTFDFVSLIKFTKEYTITHTISEVLPWYWGIFDWLGVTYPRIIHRIINKVLLVGLIGIFVFFYKVFKKKLWREKETQALIFLNMVNFFYFLGISIYDWLLWFKTGYPLGVQGRYFFPLISVHMLMFFVGWRNIFFGKRIKIWSTKILGLMILLLNTYALRLVAGIYYDLSHLKTFIIQVSQYKPWFVKGGFFVIYLTFYLLVLVLFLIKYIRFLSSQNEN